MIKQYSNRNPPNIVYSNSNKQKEEKKRMDIQYHTITSLIICIVTTAAVPPLLLLPSMNKSSTPSPPPIYCNCTPLSRLCNHACPAQHTKNPAYTMTAPNRIPATFSPSSGSPVDPTTVSCLQTNQSTAPLVNPSSHPREVKERKREKEKKKGIYTQI